MANVSKMAMEAIRDRMLEIPGLVAIVGSNIAPSYIADVQDPTYPIVSFTQSGGNHSSATYNLIDPAQLTIQCSSVDGLEECLTMYGLLKDALHLQKVAVSNTEVVFHEIREEWFNSGLYDAVVSAWVQSSRWIYRASPR